MDNNRVDDIVAMLDNLMKAEGGHVNVTVGAGAPDQLNKSVETNNSLECNGQMACSVPTLHIGLDGDENE